MRIRELPLGVHGIIADTMEYSYNVFCDVLAQTTTSPLAIPIARAEGVYLYSPDGTSYLDLISGVGVNNIGHRHPKVLQALRDQLDKHLHVMVYGECIQSAPNSLAQYFVSLLPDSLNCCYFVNSGAEANEGALKLAKRATGRTELISCHQSYHGSTHGALSVSGNSEKKNAFRPLLPDVRLIEFGKLADLDYITTRTACVLLETVQGDAGVRIPEVAYLQAVRKKCDETGTLLILDEIQCGMGRTGTLFAFEQFDIVPDILTVAKAFGGGLPLGAFVASHELMSWFVKRPAPGHITTFGGNPLSCAAALATLKVISEETLLQQVEQKGKLFERFAHHDAVVDMRRMGLMMSIDFDTREKVQKVVKNTLAGGAICFYFLSHPNGLRIAPPLTIHEDEIERGCTIIAEAIEKL